MGLDMVRPYSQTKLSAKDSHHGLAKINRDTLIVIDSINVKPKTSYTPAATPK
jgi:hypothetical protein